MGHKVDWNQRARSFDGLQWANDMRYLRAIVRLGAFKKTDLVLDVGTGTGKLAKVIAPLVRQVIGIDRSAEMLERCGRNGNFQALRWDICESLFVPDTFDKITARMVFHHILEGTQDAMNECHRILKTGGRMIVAEGVPPSATVRSDYERIFALKEERLTFMEEDLRGLLEKAGFQQIRQAIVIQRSMSIRNWLQNSDLPQATQDKIYNLHVNASDHFKKVYRMKLTCDDCLIDMRSAIMVGIKP